MCKLAHPGVSSLATPCLPRLKRQQKRAAAQEKPVQVNAVSEVAPGVNVDNMDTLPYSIMDHNADLSPMPMSQGVTPSPLGPVEVEETPPKVESLKRVLVQQFDSMLMGDSKPEIQASCLMLLGLLGLEGKPYLMVRPCLMILR